MQVEAGTMIAVTCILGAANIADELIVAFGHLSCP
jgi:hypothetical protein